jgi:uncharacterized protein YciW
MAENRDVIASIVGIEAGSELARVVEGRADIMALTQQTHDAALIPADPGGLSHETTARIADIWFDGGTDGRLKALIRHTDLVAHAPKNATRRDIELLQEAGFSDGDIVRLSELIAFVSYQIRVAAGLRLLRGLA